MTEKEAIIIAEKYIKERKSKQKFQRFDIVYVSKTLPREMMHFKKDFYALIEKSYVESYGDNSVEEYSVVPLDEITNVLSWYPVKVLTLIKEYNVTDKNR